MSPGFGVPTALATSLQGLGHGGQSLRLEQVGGANEEAWGQVRGSSGLGRTSRRPRTRASAGGQAWGPRREKQPPPGKAELFASAERLFEI